MEEGLPGASEARAAGGRADESRTDGREDSTAAEGERISQAPARDFKKSYEHTGRGTAQRYAMKRRTVGSICGYGVLRGPERFAQCLLPVGGNRAVPTSRDQRRAVEGN